MYPAAEKGGDRAAVVGPTPDELVRAFDVAGSVIDPPMDHADDRFDDLERALAEGRLLSAVALEDHRVAGAVLGFLDGKGAVLRIAGVRRDHQGEGIGRRLVAEFEHRAAALGASRISLGADAAAGFWHRVGYALALLGQWASRPDLADGEIAAIMSGPGQGLTSERHSFAEVPQLVTAVPSPSPDLLARFRAAAPHADYGYLGSKMLAHTPDQADR